MMNAISILGLSKRYRDTPQSVRRPMVVSIVSYSILLTWIYVGTGGSVLMTGLFHAALNGVAPLMAGIDPDTSWVVRNLLAAAVIAIAVVALGGLRRSGARP